MNENINSESDESNSKALEDNIHIQSLPPVEDWSYRPIFLLDRSAKNYTTSRPIGEVFEFETESFIGRALIRIRGISNNNESDDPYFTGRKRLSQTIIQGRFKRRMNCADVMIGSEFSKPLRFAPPPTIDALTQKVLKKRSPGVICELCTHNPKVLTTLCESAQVINVVDSDDLAPDIFSTHSLQEVGMLTTLRGKNTAKIKARKRSFASPSYAKGRYFDTESTYTFESYDSSIDYRSYRFHLMSLLNFDMLNILGHQPFQCMAKCRKSGEYLWRFDIIHEQIKFNEMAKTLEAMIFA